MTKQIFKIKSVKWKLAVKSLLLSMIISLVFTSVSFAEGGGRYDVDEWSFGVMGDTQWTVDGNSEDNPDHVSAAIAGALNQQFIAEGVKFVIQVGDLSDQAGNDAMYTRAAVSQTLYNEGIGFFPLRGNHETYGKLFGLDDDLDMNIPAFLDAFPQTQGTANKFGATNFSSPSDIEGYEDLEILDGLSYSFDYNDATFVIVDVEPTSYWEKIPEEDDNYGMGETYSFEFFGMTISYVVYTHTEPVAGVTTTYESTSSGPVVIEEDIPITIEPGTYFRIDSQGRPCTDFGTWELYFPIADNLSPQVSTWHSTGTEFWPGDQQNWISAKLDKNTRGTEHAFVFSHRGLMGANHADGLFGSNPGSKSSTQNTFFDSLMLNDVKYMISGHDHIHNRALVDSPDGLSQVEQIISQGASSKFYTPASLDSFISWYGDVKQRETQISQEVTNIGYYIYTVDGPRVTVDYYSDAVDNFPDGELWPDGIPDDPKTEEDEEVLGSLEVPDFDFVKQESFGYSLNGQQFLIAQGDSYDVVEDSFGDTTAMILAGKNNSTTTDLTPTVIDDNDTPEDTSDDIVVSAPRALNKTVNTGWVEMPCPKNNKWLRHHKCKSCNKLKSDILSLWGMSELGAGGVTDTYTLSMSFDFKKMIGLGFGNIGIATYVDGEWVNAVDENFGGIKKFVVGPYKKRYGLGTYGIDPKTKTAWAVLNYNADFAVADDIGSPRMQKKQKIVNKIISFLFRLFR